MHNFANDASKLAPQGSSQRNKSLNNTIVSKTSKSRHYGASAQNDYRVSAGVAQKNLSYQYVPQVMEQLDISPGGYTTLHANRMTASMKRRITRSAEPAFKRKRLFRKSARANKCSTAEICEGVSYASGIGFIDQEIDTLQIPEAIIRSELTPISTTGATIIIFDLETAAGGSKTDLTQLAAVPLLNPSDVFSEYILPNGPITKQIQNITGLSIGHRDGHRVLCRTIPQNCGASGDLAPTVTTVLDSIDVHEALNHFVLWLKKQRDAGTGVILLAAHKFCKAFDMRHLISNVTSCDLQQDFISVVSGFVDTLPYIKATYQGLTDYKQTSVYSALFQETYDCHNAEADVLALRGIVEHSSTNHPSVDMSDYSFKSESALASQQWTDGMTARLKTFEHLFTGNPKIISKTMAQKISGSGLEYKHLKCVYKRSGRDALIDLLSSKTGNKVWVTMRRDIHEALINHFVASATH